MGAKVGEGDCPQCNGSGTRNGAVMQGRWERADHALPWL